ncbi:AfsR/SARP family transcriptional regulator [Herbiconiux sp. P18]|uniref:AfsR/SARP family transcriptional regulator n=1 Tax=Herbiconiux liangxiaofengii TaxID=3342795 RepID=UPI0035B8691A
MSDAVAGQPELRVGVLGPVVVRRDGVWVEPSGARAKGLIVALVLAAPRALSIDALRDDIWGDDLPRDARGALQALVSRVRGAFGEGLIESTGSGYRLGARPTATDLGEAAASATAGRDALARNDVDDAGRHAHSGLGLWRGDPGADLAPGAVADELAARAIRVLESLELTAASAALARGANSEAADLALRLATRSPFDDAAHLLLMRALDALGRSTDAVAVYAEFRARVQDAFGTSPSAELQALNLELLDGGRPVSRWPSVSPPRVAPSTDEARSAGDDAGRPPSRTGEHADRQLTGPGEHASAAGADTGGNPANGNPTAATPSGAVAPATSGNPATPATPAAPETDSTAGDPSPRGIGRGIRAAPNALIGRDSAVTDVLRSLEQARVTTILGPGGLGKTRLAHEVAGRALARFGFVVVVELASVRDPGDVVIALATALGIRELTTSRRVGDQVARADLRTRILTRLAEQPTLLVVDNCEHLIDAAAGWVAELTAELPQLTVLATSRTPLALSSERVFALQPLGRSDDRTPGAEQTSTGETAGEADDDPAVRLFIDRATAARPGAALPRDVVARLCERLDGLPLAIELAAARIRSMSLDEIERRLGNRFSLLTGGDRGAPERHRTLLAVIEWSWNLLDTDEQRTLAYLSDFADGFSADAARAVVAPASDGGAVDDALDSLVAQSLVTVAELPGIAGGGLRFRMLETVREFGRLQLTRLGESDAARDALFDWADITGRSLQPQLTGPRQVEVFALVGLEEDNLIDLLRRAIAAERPDIVAGVFPLLANHWVLRSTPTEVVAFAQPVLDSVRRYRPEPERVDALAWTLVFTGIGLLSTGDRRFAGVLSQLRKTLGTREHDLRREHDPRGEHNPDAPRLLAMSSLLLAMGDSARVLAAVDTLQSSPDPQAALLGCIAGAAAAENAGRPRDAGALARRAVTIAESLGDTWGAATAGQLLAQLHSQSAEPVEALRWARRSRDGMVRIAAVEDLRQLDWMIAVNELALGRIDDASRVFEDLVRTPGQADGVDIVSIGLAGRAEVLRARGLHAEAAGVNREVLSSFRVPRTKASPWYQLILSSVLATLIADGTGEPGETRTLARRLRSRVLAVLRITGGTGGSIGGLAGSFTDNPVLGASAVGLASWASTSTEPGLRAVAAELLALAEAMGARQDNPGLHLAPLFARFSAEEVGRHALGGDALGDDPVAAARASARLVHHAERPERVAALLRTPGPWSWGWKEAT